MVTANLAPIIADTHALVWYLTQDTKLSQTAFTILSEVDNGARVLMIPVVILAELVMIAEKGRTSLTVPQLHQTIQLWEVSPNIHLTQLSPQIVVHSIPMTVIPDIFDRLLVAEAHLRGVAIVTRDPVIINSRLVNTYW